MEQPQLIATIAGLLRAEGLDDSGLALSPIGGGGNNRVFAVDARGGRLLAKAYFSDAADTRDRLGVEYGFLRFATGLGLGSVPRPVARCSQQRVGLYEFIAGTRLDPAQLQREHVMAAARFFSALNADTASGKALPAASDACFDVSQHLSSVERRIERLRALQPRDALDHQAQRLAGELATVWTGHCRRIAAAGLPGLGMDERCISPSDFGFHNALRKADGTLCFIDFEYAGWDDPAKMIGDFFCQPAVPVPAAYFDDFISAALAHSRTRETLRARAHLLLPVMQAKWCCIMLNEFLPESARRRRFADPSVSPTQRKLVQLDKARRFFQSTLA